MVTILPFAVALPNSPRVSLVSQDYQHVQVWRIGYDNDSTVLQIFLQCVSTVASLATIE